MNRPPKVTLRDMLRMTLCLATTCLIAGIILGVTYRCTEPTRQRNATVAENQTVRRLLHLEATAEVLEIRRYLEEGSAKKMAYLLPNELRFYNLEGREIQAVARPVEERNFSAEEQDAWVKQQFPAGYFADRFFIGKNSAQQVVGTVIEGKQHGFKSLIRFFVALDPNFTILGVEVVSHEEDPGLGAEIAKPKFQNQFVGKTFSEVTALEVTRDAASGPEKIHAVTGATISSRALMDGVKRAVDHLHHRLPLIFPQEVAP